MIFGAIAASWLPLQDPEQIKPIDRLQGPSGEALVRHRRARP